MSGESRNIAGMWPPRAAEDLHFMGGKTLNTPPKLRRSATTPTGKKRTRQEQDGLARAERVQCSESSSFLHPELHRFDTPVPFHFATCSQ